MPALGDRRMRIAKVQQSSGQVVVGLGERNPQGERMPVRRQGPIVLAHIHERIAELQTGGGVPRIECQSLLETDRRLADLSVPREEDAQSVPVIRATRLTRDCMVQGGERLTCTRGLMEKRLEQTRPIPSIGLLGNKPASIGFRTTQLSRPHRG